MGESGNSHAVLLLRLDARDNRAFGGARCDVEEFEEVVTNPECEDVSRSTGNPVAFGLTSTGRHLCCVFKRLGDDLIEPVTGYDVGE